MRRKASILITILLVLVFYLPAHAAPAQKSKGDVKDPLVLMPLKVEAVDRSMLAAMETALVEGLQDKYTVYSGENVAKKAREIFTKESRVKKECDETRCLQDIAMAFQAELIAVASVTKRSDGFFIALSIRNIMDEKDVYSKSLPCKGCDEYQVVDTLKTLAGGGVQTSSPAGGGAVSTSSSKGRPAPSSPASSAVPSGDFSLDELDSQAKAEEERKASEKAKWDKYLTEMKKAFGQVEGYEKRDISNDLKVTAWEKFLKSYKEDDPYSTEDEEMREKAKGSIENIKNRGETASGNTAGMVFVKSGCFQMGDTFGDGNADEKPAHNVCVSDFYMSKYEVTVGEFRQFVDSTNYRTEAETDGGCYVSKDGKFQKDGSITWRNPGFQQTEKDPVICVSWNDANKYAGWKSRSSGKAFRLPTEAEWEYAARSGGKKYKYPWGNGGPSDNIADEAQKKAGWNGTFWDGYNDGYVYTAPVGSFTPNEAGLYDMGGNAAEWVSDWYDGGYYGNSPKDNPKGPSSGQYRVFRGGSWYTRPASLRASRRIGYTPDGRYWNIGFRLALSAK